jgi:ATP-dependent DNA helicase RecG
MLARKGLHTLLDLFYFTPVRYEDRRRLLPIGKTQEGESAWVKGRVISGGEERFFRSGKRLFKIVMGDETAPLDLLWFQYKAAYLNRLARGDAPLMAYGQIRLNRGRRQMIHPDVKELGQTDETSLLGLFPVYSSIEGISDQFLRSTVRRALREYHTELVDPMPQEIPCRLGLPALYEALRDVHFPDDDTSVDLLNVYRTPAHRRLVFDRFFRVMLTLSLRKRSRMRRTGPVFRIPEGLEERLEAGFRFKLTKDQLRAIRETIGDMRSGRPMNRLLQGDVGCGKTVVAAAVSYVTVHNGRQVALMAPTQVLARQHHEYFSELSEKMGFRSVLLTGAMKRQARHDAYDKIRDGTYNLVIGTQSLIGEDLVLPGLGLVVIDEQHRFGVRQRALLDRKGGDSHMLVMTATPIPRTLAMTLYADMDYSVIREYPKGHRPVSTELVNGSQKQTVYHTLINKISTGQQAMVICPVIEASEEEDLKNALEMYRRLKRLLEPEYRVGLIHGRLSGDEKEQVMDRFRKGRMHVLVGTTVVEVGVHAPGATLMVVENPERFGLAQLHQLRGRIGRGEHPGLCLLVADDDLPERTKTRLKILLESSDGFHVAEKDLEMRGQGQLTGIRQAGAGELDFSEMFREPELLVAAKAEAERMLKTDPKLSDPRHEWLRALAASTVADPADL